MDRQLNHQMVRMVDCGGGVSSVVARGLVILWVTGSIPEVGESFRRRLKDSLIDWESAMGNS